MRHDKYEELKLSFVDKAQRVVILFALIVLLINELFWSK